MRIKRTNLYNLKLKTFTEQDVEDYCLLNNINPDNITELDLNNNELTDISGIKLFKNLKQLNTGYNKLTDISVLKDLINLTELYIHNNKITDISVLKKLIKLEKLHMGYNKIKDISVLSNFKNIKTLYIDNLQLESDQIEYIKSLKKLKSLWPEKGFKNMKVLKQLKI